MTDPLDIALNGYPDLGPAEREALEAQVRSQRPDLLPQLREVQRLAEALDLVRDDEEDRLMAFVTDRVFGRSQPASADATDAALADRIAAFAPADPRARFEALRSPGAAPAPVRARPERAPVVHQRARRPVWGRLAVAGLVATVALAGVLVLGRPAGLNRLGGFTPEELQVEGYGATRGATSSATNPNETRYLAALARLSEARRTTFGLFPRYDPAALDAARTDLDAVVAAELADSFLGLEARYALGKVHLLRGDRAAARAALTPVMAAGGPRSTDADRLLRALDGED